MSWSIGYCSNHKRDIGYGVPAPCDHPGCNVIIDRGMSYLCCENIHHSVSCGGYFCAEHRDNYVYADEVPDMDDEELEALGLDGSEAEEDDDDGVIACRHRIEPRKEAVEWLEFMLSNESWQKWRELNPERVQHFKERLANKGELLYVIVDPYEEKE